jgi:hypothetical protein
MAELTTMRNDVLGYPIYGLPYVVAFPILDVDGDPVTGLTPDSEISKNGDTAVDTATEAAEIAFDTATNKGMYQLQLSAAEMTANVVTITVYTGSADAQATPIVLYPKQLPLLVSGTAGATGDDTTHIHLAGLSAINDYYNGCLIFLKDHTGANQVRLITDYVGATALATVAPAFATAPDNTTDYEIYLTDLALPTLMTNLTYDVVRAQHTIAGTYGEVTTAAQLIADLLDHLLAGHSGAGSVGKAIIDILAAAIVGIKKNTALANFTFLMVDSAGAPLTGLTITAQRSIDGSAFGACTNAASEISVGYYKINLSAADLNGDIITLRFTAAGAAERSLTFKTES